MKISSKQVQLFVFIVCILFIGIDLLRTISTPYELLRVVFYGIAVNLLSDYITKAKKRSKK